MSRTLKEVRENLLEATVASKTNLQYIRAKTASNNHFEARRYIAKEILRDTNLAAAYTSLEMIHDKYARVIGNDAITIRQRLERMMMADLKRKVKQIVKNLIYQIKKRLILQRQINLSCLEKILIGINANRRFF